ncbi:fungal-specific transcription factor domain-containing protein [Xylogone sp. PMI_703]|nr:fungal-specific transcription factor domain-containing protein [Xylogone sp. PMI_703]
MRSPLRSKQGCWTCRLRKKKCDQTRPQCSICESLSITCYGFGSKPDWMDSGKERKTVANSLKEIVKHTSKRRSTAQSSSKHSEIVKIAPKPTNDSVESSYSPRLSQHRLEHSSSTEHIDNLMIRPVFSISTNESVLLMHFIDNVFPLQYPMYKPRILDGGRGWLLALLLRTKPLYHAALAMSAYHRRMTILGETSHFSQAALLVEQEKHVELCIKSVSKFAENSCQYNGLGVTTAVTQLVIFELYNHRSNAWQTHLRAVMNMYQKGHEKSLWDLGASENSEAILRKDLLPDESMVVEKVVSLRFFNGMIIWLDLISSITAGKAPQLLLHHHRILATDSQIKLEDIVGCKNWVMLQIGQISMLHERKIQTLRQGRFDYTEFEQISNDVEREIQRGLTGSSRGWNTTDYDSAVDASLDPLGFITHIFTRMASIYLHLVIHGFEKLEQLDTITVSTMRILQNQTTAHLLHSLVAPLYIIGSVSRREDEQFFRKIFSSLPLLDSSLQHRAMILPILEEIWNRRRNVPHFTWQDSLALISDILLI